MGVRVKLSRISSVVAAAAIAPAVLFASPAVAADTATASADSAPDTAPDAKPDTQGNAKADDDNRLAILRIIHKSKPGSSVYEAAQAAMNGSPEDRVRFLKEGHELAQFADDRLRTVQISSTAGKGLRKAAVEALRKGTHEALRQFLEVGQYAARDEDNCVEISRILHTAKRGSVLYESIQKALDGSPEDRARFLEVGQYEARETDDRILVTRISGSGGRHLKEAARKALLSDKAEDIRHFLDIGQYEARKLDDAEAAKAKGDKDQENAEEGQESKDVKATSDEKLKQGGAKDVKGAMESNGTTGAKPAVATAGTGSSGAQLAATGTGSATPWAVGGTAVTLTAGAGLILASRRRASQG
ncbi:ALF repeat-containing protein [Streptomyces sp. CT34]|uniref:ALF repeat-containing protein n=1 Tax=Streptomyces sp. CT34 TaxID=1553907 RepID=UPI0012FF0898|nr:ALF repeat-containing protein [Streptomyces sp. CT34]